MENRTWTYPEIKALMPPGEWQDEPDKEQWIDQETGLPCLIVRHLHDGNLCGYVGLSKGHPLWDQPYDDIEGVIVHGGLTYSGFCNGPICHEVEAGDTTYWLGFDCGHIHADLKPGWLLIARLRPMMANKELITYKNIEYVKDECALLAKQLKNYPIR